MTLTRRQVAVLALPFVLVVIPFMIAPAAFGLVASFTNYAPFQNSPAHFIGFTNYSRVLQDADFRAAIRNITLFAAVTVALELIIGVAIAYALRTPFRGRRIARFVLLIPWLISPVANGVMWHFLLEAETGLLNFWPALVGLRLQVYPLSYGWALPTAIAVEVWRKAPLVSFLTLPGLLAIPAVNWDVADLDGLSTFNRIRHIVLPRLRLLLLTITLLLLGDALGASDSILILTGGGPGQETITPGLYSYRQALKIFNWSDGATSAWLIAAAVLLIGIGYILLARHETNP